MLYCLALALHVSVCAIECFDVLDLSCCHVSRVRYDEVNQLTAVSSTE